MAKQKTATPGLVAGWTEAINRQPANIRLLLVQCIISGDVLVTSPAKEAKGQVQRTPKYAPLPRPELQKPNEIPAGLWVPGQ